MGVVIAVLGMHRSGTSAVAGVLARTGFAVPGEALPPTSDNPRGYWEPREVVEAHDELLRAIGASWSDPRALPSTAFEGEAAVRARRRLAELLARREPSRRGWVLKDPRLCRLLPLWLPILEEAGMEVRFLHVLRSPVAVARSLASRDRLGLATSLLLWLRYLLEAELATRGRDRLWMRFEDWVGGSRGLEVDRLARWLGAGGELTEMAAAVERGVDLELVHHALSPQVEADVLSRFTWVETAYRDLLGLCRDPAVEPEWLDRLRSFLDAADAFSGIYDGTDQPYLVEGAGVGPVPRGRSSFDTRLDALTAQLGLLQQGLSRVDEAWRRQLEAQAQLGVRWSREQERSVRLLAELVEEQRSRSAVESELAKSRNQIELLSRQLADADLVGARRDDEILRLLSEVERLRLDLGRPMGARGKPRQSAGSVARLDSLPDEGPSA